MDDWVSNQSSAYENLNHKSSVLSNNSVKKKGAICHYAYYPQTSSETMDQLWLLRHNPVPDNIYCNAISMW